MVHVSRLDTAHEIWTSLEAIHETRGHQVAISIQRTLFRMCAQDDDNIVEHLTKLKKQWERLNMLDDEDFRITDTQFKTIIASSLPKSWDTFTDPYVGRRKGTPETDPKKLTSSQEFIGIIKEEYIRCKARNDAEPISNQTYTTKQHSDDHQTLYSHAPSNPSHRPLADRIQDGSSNGLACRNCGHTTHITDNCRWLGQPKCNKCGWFGHLGTKCKRQPNQKRKYDQGGGGRKPKKVKREQAHAMLHSDNKTEDEIVFSAEERHNFDAYDPCNFEIDDHLIYYDWLADTATTSHVTNMRDAFISFQSLQNTPVDGVGGATAYAKGRGTIELKSEVNGNTYTLTLKNVLYIPTNPHNLLSLGRWDASGGYYNGGNGQLSLKTKNGQTVAKGIKINNHLYKMNKLTVRKSGLTYPIKETTNPQSFSAGEPAKSWEVWHRRFGHIGMSSLQKLLDGNFVEGFNVDIRTPKYDCEACTQAKCHIPYFLGLSPSFPGLPATFPPVPDPFSVYS